MPTPPPTASNGSICWSHEQHHSWKAEDIRRTVSSAIGTIVHLVRSDDGRRTIDHIAHVHHSDRRVIDTVHRAVA